MPHLDKLLRQLPRLIIPAKPVMEFTLFSNLPAEVRILIWGHAANEPRDFFLWRQGFGIGAYARCYSRHRGYQRSLPAVMEACRESREGKKHYERVFQFIRLPSRVHCRAAPAWINFDFDRLWVPADGATVSDLRNVDRDGCDPLDNYNYDRATITRIRNIEFECNSRYGPSTIRQALSSYQVLLSTLNGINLIITASRQRFANVCGDKAPLGTELKVLDKEEATRQALKEFRKHQAWKDSNIHFELDAVLDNLTLATN